MHVDIVTFLGLAVALDLFCDFDLEAGSDDERNEGSKRKDKA